MARIREWAVPDAAVRELRQRWSLQVGRPQPDRTDVAAGFRNLSSDRDSQRSDTS